MQTIIKALKEFPQITNYKICETQKTSYETFFVHEKLETVRSTSTTDRSVTVYCGHDGKLGHSVFAVYASTTEQELRQKITLAIQKAMLVNNQAYELPEKESLSDNIDSNMSEYSPAELAQQIAKACFEARSEEKASINALEIFINKICLHIVNGNGLDKREQKYTAMIEAIPTWTDGDSVELYERYDFSSFHYDEIKEELAGKMQEVKDRYLATKPSIPPTCRVVLNASELSELLNTIVYELSYQSVYAHANAFSKGDALQDGDCDKLSVTLCGQIEGSHRNRLFDDDGVSLTPTTVIENGVVVSYHGDNRFAQYLGEKITGNLPCMQVKAGSISEQDMAKEPYFECVSMSGLQVDIYNDYIGGEVRLAYYFDGEKKTPLTGISISGKLSEALSTLRLSNKTVMYGGYLGPHKAVLDKISII